SGREGAELPAERRVKAAGSAQHGKTSDLLEVLPLQRPDEASRQRARQGLPALQEGFLRHLATQPAVDPCPARLAVHGFLFLALPEPAALPMGSGSLQMRVTAAVSLHGTPGPADRRMPNGAVWMHPKTKICL